MSQNTNRSEMRLYDRVSERLYINQSERTRLLAPAKTKPAFLKAFILTLVYTGCRLSEARNLTVQSLQAEEGILAIRTLKRRKLHVREIPIPTDLISAIEDHLHHRTTEKDNPEADNISFLKSNTRRKAAGKAGKTEKASHQEFENKSQNNTPLWQKETGGPINRITAYRWIKEIMREADIHGPQASPKGLRHGFGIHAVSSAVPLTLVAKWMGHSSIKTTAIYTNAVGQEEREMAQRMWRS